MKNKTKTILNLLKKCFIILTVLIFSIKLANAQNSSQFISITAPIQVTPGQVFTASITFKNTGTTTWTTGGNTPYRLGTQNPQDNETWGRLRVELPVSQVLPNATVTFSFTATAPTTSGTYNFQWKMVKELVEWFGATTPNKIIQVGTTTPALIDDAQVISVPITSLPVTTITPWAVSIDMKNNGTTTWVKGIYYLASENYPNNTNWGTNRIDLWKDVLPGEVISIYSGTLISPPTTGYYPFQWRMSKGGNTRFGETVLGEKTLTNYYNSSFVSLYFSSSNSYGLKTNQYSNIQIKFKNISDLLTSNDIWTTIGVFDVYYGSTCVPKLFMRFTVNGNQIYTATASPTTSSIPRNGIATYNIPYYAPAYPCLVNYSTQLYHPITMKYFGQIIYGSIRINALNKTASISFDDNSDDNIEFKVMPNPATDFMNILLPIVDGTQALKIFDITGKIVYSNEYSNTSNIELNVSQFKKGIYFLKIDNQTNSYCKKVVIN